MLITSAVLLAAVAFLIVQNWRRNAGPVYGSRSLEKWVVQYWSPKGEGAVASNNAARARGAIKAIGTNGLPYLLTWINHEDSRKKRTARFIVNGILFDLSRVTRGQKTFEYYDTTRANGAMLGLILVQPQDSDTFMKLTNLFKTGGDSSRSRSGRVLIHFGEAGARFFATELTNGSPAYRIDAISFIGRMGEAARPVIPSLIQALDHSRSDITEAAVRALGRLRRDPELSVPALDRKLRSSSGWIQSSAAQALGNFGAAANSSVPFLVQAIEESTNSPSWWAFTNALHEIAPDDYATRFPK